MKRTMIPIYPKSNRKDKEVVDGYYIVAMPSYAYLLDNLNGVHSKGPPLHRIRFHRYRSAHFELEGDPFNGLITGFIPSPPFLTYSSVSKASWKLVVVA